MAHLIRDLWGTNRDEHRGPWRVCETCPEDAETETLRAVVDLVASDEPMTLEEFWSRFVAEKLALALEPPAETA